MSEIRLNNLKKLVNGFDSQREFADAIDKTPAYLNHLMTGFRNIGEKTARQIEVSLNLPRGWMDIDHNLVYDASNGEGIAPSIAEKHLDNNLRPGPKVRGEVPLISFVQAGEWREAIDNYSPGNGERMIPVTVPVGRHTFALRVTGDSMEPEFVEGEIIIVEPDLDAVHKDFVIAKNGGDATFKQLWKEAGEWMLKPLNERYPIKPLGDSHIIGVVREKTKIYR